MLPSLQEKAATGLFPDRHGRPARMKGLPAVDDTRCRLRVCMGLSDATFPARRRSLPQPSRSICPSPCLNRWNNVSPPNCRSGRSRCRPPSPCWTKGPPCRSLPATARKSPAIWMTPSCVTWTNASPTCASWMPAARPSWIRSPNRASSRPSWPHASTRPTASSDWRICTPPTSPSVAPRRRLPAKPDWNRWPMPCWPTPCWCPRPRQPPI